MDSIRGGKKIKSGQGWRRADEDKIGWKGMVVKSSVVPLRPCKVME